jgi:large conductance mechanosensitive channel
MLQEFKKFALRGNLIDIAIGLVMATSFNSVTSAFVDGTFLPLVGQIFQMGNMAHAKWILSPAIISADGKVVEAESAIMYGALISSIINFIIIAFIMFMIIKIMNKLKGDEPVAPAGPTQEQLLTEIRDLLRRN